MLFVAAGNDGLFGAEIAALRRMTISGHIEACNWTARWTYHVDPPADDHHPGATLTRLAVRLLDGKLSQTVCL